jgi:hypothetical protein
MHACVRACVHAAADSRVSQCRTAVVADTRDLCHDTPPNARDTTIKLKLDTFQRRQDAIHTSSRRSRMRVQIQETAQSGLEREGLGGLAAGRLWNM